MHFSKAHIVIMVLPTLHHGNSCVSSFTCIFKIPRVIGTGGLYAPDMFLLEEELMGQNERRIKKTVNRVAPTQSLVCSIISLW